MEDTKVPFDEIPSEPDELYIQLYCKRKGVNDEATLLKARKTWMSLSDTKKKPFYKMIENKNILKYAHGLSKSAVYLKEKRSKSHHENSQSSQVHREDITDEQLTNPYEAHLLENTTPVHENSFQKENSIVNEIITPNHEETQNVTKSEIYEDMKEDASEQDTLGPLQEPEQSIQLSEEQLETHTNTSSIQIPAISLVAPTPPTVKAGRDLYEVLKGPEDPLWKDLSKRDKNRYYSVVWTLKRDYIQSYLKYLESLNQQQLYEVYMKTFYS